MTVCVAGICDTRNSIVVAADMKLSISGWTSGENLLKWYRIHQDWIALFAGDDLSRVEPIVSGVWKQLNQKESCDSIDLSAKFTASYQECRKREAENLFLGVYGLDMERFLKDGKKLFNPTELSALHQSICSVNLQCEFMCAGFDKAGVAHIFTVSHPGVANYHDAVGY